MSDLVTFLRGFSETGRRPGERQRIVEAADRIEALESKNANMLAHLQAAAGWSDEDMHNPIMAIAARNCARSGLATSHGDDNALANGK